MRYLITVLALAGVVVSVLALKVHYSTATEPCSINEHWDCGVVNHSPFAVMAHVPVAAIGIAGYLVLSVLAMMRARFSLFLTAVFALIFSLRLTFIEEFDLLTWCLYCVISQTIIALIFLLSMGWFAAEYARLRKAARSS
jgi:vitamin-K-epoxide reductase (warfarin-sensitive)